jgi:hypothetical protein
MAQHAPLVAVNSAPLGTICLDRQPQWRIGPLPGCWVSQAAWGRTQRPKLCKLACRGPCFR